MKLLYYFLSKTVVCTHSSQNQVTMSPLDQTSSQLQIDSSKNVDNTPSSQNQAIMSPLDRLSSQLQIDSFKQMTMVNQNLQMNNNAMLFQIVNNSNATQMIINAASVQIVNTINATPSTTSSNKRQRSDSTISSTSTFTNVSDDELSTLRQCILDKDQDISALRESVASLEKRCKGKNMYIAMIEWEKQELKAENLKLRSQLQEKNGVFKREVSKVEGLDDGNDV